MFPTCVDGKKDCFAHHDGTCSALASTMFVEKSTGLRYSCPFYKTKMQIDTEENKCFERLTSLGLGKVYKRYRMEC